MSMVHTLLQLINNQMKSYGLVLDQSLQPNKPYQHLQHNSKPQTFPSLSKDSNNTQSYSTVVQQALITKDKPLLKEIIADSDNKTLNNTMASISIDKVSTLLSLLEQFLNQDSRHTSHYSNWLKHLLRHHIGLILSNSQNKNTIARLAKFIQRKTSQRQAILRIRSALSNNLTPQASKQFKPKFHYKQRQQRNKGQGEKLQQQMGMEGQQFDEEMMLEQFDE